MQPSKNTEPVAVADCEMIISSGEYDSENSIKQEQIQEIKEEEEKKSYASDIDKSNDLESLKSVDGEEESIQEPIHEKLIIVAAPDFELTQ